MLISGVTVMIAMAGMFFSGDKTFMSFAVGTMMVVAVAMLGSLTVLPCHPVLARRPRRTRCACRSSGRSEPPGVRASRVGRDPGSCPPPARSISASSGHGRAPRHGRIPALTSCNTAISGLDALPASLKELQSYNRVNDAFPGGADPAVVAIKGDASDPRVQAAVADLKAKALASGKALEPIHVEASPNGKVLRVDIPLVGSGTGRGLERRARHAADAVLPRHRRQGRGPGIRGHRQHGRLKDSNEKMKSSAPLVVAFVLAFAFLLAARLVSLDRRPAQGDRAEPALGRRRLRRARGVFQYTWGEGLLDFKTNGDVISWLPMFLFVILFGLSMDYHVFILSRVREYYDRGLDTEHAVAKGIKATAGVVTSAAIVMVLVFGVFALMPIVDMKEMGIGLAAAILIDATIVRAVLLPATMKLLGKWNWYLPTWLEWLPSLEHERSPEPAPQPSSTARQEPARAGSWRREDPEGGRFAAAVPWSSHCRADAERTFATRRDGGARAWPASRRRAGRTHPAGRGCRGHGMR